MRKIAKVKNHPETKRVMISYSKNEVLLFLYNKEADTSCYADQWHESIEDAEEFCDTNYGIKANDWTTINETPDGCQSDIIAPVRIKGRNLGKPVWGQYEKLENGKWISTELE